jgi:cell division protein FtsW
MDLTNNFFKGDRTVWIIFILMCLISLVEVFSASSHEIFKAVSRGKFFWAPIAKHATFLFMGFVAAWSLSHVKISKYFSIIALIGFVFSIVLLIVTYFIGKEVNEASRFLSIGGYSFQPSEIAKISCIIFVAFVLSRTPDFLTANNKFWIITVGVGIACLWILPENFSTAFLLGLVCFLVMILGNLPWKKMLILLAVVVLFLAVIASIPDETLRKYSATERVMTWKGRVKDHIKYKNQFTLEGSNFQPGNAKIAIARGGLTGRMPGRSIQRDFLPIAHSDFIYAIVIEELGLIFGGTLVMLLYIVLMFRVGIIARKCKKTYPKYIVLGSGLMIVIQALFNMLVAVGLFPVTGQPLPLISSGGTSMIITCCYFGIILSVSRFGAGIEDGEKKEEEKEEEETMEEEEEEEEQAPVEEAEPEEGEDSAVDI